MSGYVTAQQADDHSKYVCGKQKGKLTESTQILLYFLVIDALLVWQSNLKFLYFAFHCTGIHIHHCEMRHVLKEYACE